VRTGGLRLSVFAVEDTTAQLTWRALPEGEVVLRAGEATARIEVTDPDAPGAIVLAGLAPGRRHDVRMTIDGRDAGVVARPRTLTPPPGEELGRFATVSDLHIGERGFGVWPRFREDPKVPTERAYPARCSRAAVVEAAAWGAERTIAKGDLTWSGRQLQWEATADVLAASPVPVHATLGNHDVVPKAADGRGILARRGIDIPTEPEALDLPGLRLILAHSADAGHRQGAVPEEQVEQLVELIGSAPGAAFVAMHHYVDALPFPSRYPRGIPKAEGDDLLRRLAAANPATFLSFGHTHRHRRKTRFGLTMTEVGSTKDHPGVWAGYAVHEGGIRQVVRRVAEPACLAWTERCRHSLFGLWGPWAAGRLPWRCFSLTWPTRP
jgi:hypothetical protein